MFSLNLMQDSNVDCVMNIPMYELDVAAAVEPTATVSLADTQSPYIINPPSRTTLEWRRIDPSLNTAVAPLLRKPLVPFHKTEKGKAYKAAIYYSECFLRGITPNDADNAAAQIDTQYQKWWVQSGHNDDDNFPRDGMPVVTAREGDTVSLTSLKRKYMPALNDDLSIAKRPREKESIRDVVDAVLSEGCHLTNAADHAELSLLHTSNENQLTQASVDDDKEHHLIDSFVGQDIPNLSSVSRKQIEGIRDEIIVKLRLNGGDVDDPLVKDGLSILESFYVTSDMDARRVDTGDFPYDTDGTWLTLSRPTYSESRGKNRYGESIYSLGRMSFDMFRPTNLQCSIQGIFNTVQLLDPTKGELPYSMPKQIRKELGKSLTEGVKGLRTYNIIVALTIEPNQSRRGKSGSECPPGDVTRPIRGIMTNYGYLLPDPDVPNRVSIWFTGGSLEVNDEERDLRDWKKIFGNAPNRNMSEFARVLAAKVLLGASMSDEMEENGTLSYTLKRPIGGHGTAFCDVLFVDEKLRVLRGHCGSMLVFVRPELDDYR